MAGASPSPELYGLGGRRSASSSVRGPRWAAIVPALGAMQHNAHVGIGIFSKQGPGGAARSHT